MRGALSGEWGDAGWWAGIGNDWCLGDTYVGMTCPPRPLVCAPDSIAPAVVHEYA